MYKGIHPPLGRPIVSGIRYFLKSLSQFCFSFLQPLVTKTPSFLKGTTDVLNLLGANQWQYSHWSTCNHRSRGTVYQYTPRCHLGGDRGLYFYRRNGYPRHQRVSLLNVPLWHWKRTSYNPKINFITKYKGLKWAVPLPRVWPVYHGRPRTPGFKNPTLTVIPQMAFTWSAADAKSTTLAWWQGHWKPESHNIWAMWDAED